MKKLAKSAFNQAKNYLAAEARKLEWRLFEFYFDGSEGSREKVIEELKRFQNPDGGFGRALEPDVRMEDSSVVATKSALHILIDIEAPAQERLVQKGIAYLLKSFMVPGRQPGRGVHHTRKAGKKQREVGRCGNAGNAQVVERL